jgi:hypothetical protein
LQGKLVNSKAVFHLALAPMAIFYALFAAVLLPNAAVLHPVALAEQYIHMLPESLSCFVKVVANWSYTLFFILGELYGSVAISLLFWCVVWCLQETNSQATHTGHPWCCGLLGLCLQPGLLVLSIFEGRMQGVSLKLVRGMVACSDRRVLQTSASSAAGARMIILPAGRWLMTCAVSTGCKRVCPQAGPANDLTCCAVVPPCLQVAG